MVMAALKGTRMCWLKQNGWWNEPTDNNDQFLERQLEEVMIRYDDDEITFDDKDKGIADAAHQTWMSEIIVNEVAETEEVELNLKTESEENYEEVMGFPPDETPFKNWIQLVSSEIRE
jgi:hypothetical protein